MRRCRCSVHGSAIKNVIGDTAEILPREAFYQADHQFIFDALMKLYEENRPIDLLILREELAARQLLNQAGGDSYLRQLLNTVPSAAHAAHYAAIVREKWLMRCAIALGNQTLRDIHAPYVSAQAIVDRAEARVFSLVNQKGPSTDISFASTLTAVFTSIEDRGRRGVETDFRELDDMLNGLQNGELIIIAARPSMGKTAFAMNIIEAAAANHQVPCAVFSLEMSTRQLVQRLLCSRASIDAQRTRKGMLRAEEFSKLAKMVVELATAPIWFDDSPALTVLGLRAKARRLKRQHDIGLIMIDYMQLMDHPGVESRQQQISEISRGIKSIARELNIPVICLSQLNRSSENREDHRPRMSDLRESGSIEQDADVIMLLHREDYYRRSDPDFLPDNVAEVIIAKQRNGPTGTVRLVFDSRTTTFRNSETGFAAF